MSGTDDLGKQVDLRVAKGLKKAEMAEAATADMLKKINKSGPRHNGFITDGISNYTTNEYAEVDRASLSARNVL